MTKKTYYFILVLFSNLVMAQNQNVILTKEIQKINNLIEYNQLDEAEKSNKKLYQLFSTKYSNKTYLEQRLKVRLQQGIIEDNRYEHTVSIPIFYEVLDEAEKNRLDRIIAETYYRIAFSYEKVENFDLAYKYLNDVYELSKKNKYYDLYSSIFVRFASLHRYMADGYIAPDQTKGILKNFKGSMDSAVVYAERAIEYAKKHNKEYDLYDANLTMGILYMKERKNEIAKSNAYYLKALEYSKKTKNYEDIAIMNYNIAFNYTENNEIKQALQHNNAGYVYYNKMSVFYKGIMPNQRAKLYHLLGKNDSAYHYLRIAYRDESKRRDLEELTNTKKLEREYDNNKKEATIKSKNKQMLLIGILLGIIILASVLLFLQNRKINSRNKVINRQLAELSKTLDQKQVLLSELQHRVKNNLQHVISILEIQKESVDFNNIDELIRGNQNRIHSMALLHKKLNVTDNVNEVDLKKYITELSEVVKESYDNHKKKIQLNVKCDIEKMSIEKALPIGLIVTELVSNSIKHAFKKRSIGIISIDITNENLQKNKLYYSDNGSGFDFNKTNEKGLGMEIIKGLIDQIDGSTETKNSNGFELTIYFK